MRFLSIVLLCWVAVVCTSAKPRSTTIIVNHSTTNGADPEVLTQGPPVVEPVDESRQSFKIPQDFQAFMAGTTTKKPASTTRHTTIRPSTAGTTTARLPVTATTTRKSTTPQPKAPTSMLQAVGPYLLDAVDAGVTFYLKTNSPALYATLGPILDMILNGIKKSLL